MDDADILDRIRTLVDEERRLRAGDADGLNQAERRRLEHVETLLDSTGISSASDAASATPAPTRTMPPSVRRTPSSTIASNRRR